MALIHILDRKTDNIIATLNNEKGEYKDSLITNSLENKSTFDFIALKKFDKLEKRNRLLVQDADGFFSEFIINYAEQYKRNEKNIKSDASFIDLKKAKVIEPIHLEGQTQETAAHYALERTEWQPGDIDYINIRTITITDLTNPYDFLKQVASTFGLELRFRVVVKGGHISGRFVDLKKQIAGFEGKEITFGKDLIGIRRIEDSSHIVTALLGVGSEKEDGSRPAVLVENEEALQRWGRNGQHLIDAYEPEASNQDVTEERLRILTQNELEKRIDAAVSYECESVSLEHVFGRSHERIRLGQTVRIKDEGYNPPLYLEARIQEVQENPATRKIVSFKIGNFIEYKKEDLEKQVKLLKQLMSDRLSSLIIATVTSSAGTVFKNGTGSTTLTANALLSGSEFDPEGKKYNYLWSKHDKTGNLIPSFSKNGKSITVTAAEIDEKATFVVVVQSDKVSVPAQITISNVFDGEDGQQGPQGPKGDKGEPGVPGVQGPPGKDGQTLYTWVKYANDKNGSGMSDLPDGKAYIGFAYNKPTPVESTNPADYQWAKIEGDQGVKGADGKTYYTWLKYADTPTSGMSDSPAGKKYMGLAYNKTTPTESTNYADYQWSLIQGPQGPQGVQGPKGADGKSLYTWVKYADNDKGAGMSDYPMNKKYIGLAYNKPTPTESTNPSDYTWAKMEGDQGAPGAPGKDGQPTFTWVKYADDDKGAGMSDSPVGKRWLGLAHNKTTQIESTNPNDYLWSPLYDNVEVGSRNLARKDIIGTTSTPWTENNYVYRLSTNDRSGIKLDNSIFQQGEHYVLSFKIRKISGNITSLAGHAHAFVDFKVYRDGQLVSNNWSGGINNNPYPNDNNMHEYVIYFKAANMTALDANLYIQPNRDHYGLPYVAEIWDLQVEKGNVATDWTPAPEDIEKEIQEAERKSKQYADQQDEGVYQDGTRYTDQRADQVKQHADTEVNKRVEKTKVIERINESPESDSIAGRKVGISLALQGGTPQYTSPGLITFANQWTSHHEVHTSPTDWYSWKTFDFIYTDNSMRYLVINLVGGVQRAYSPYDDQMSAVGYIDVRVIDSAGKQIAMRSVSAWSASGGAGLQFKIDLGTTYKSHSFYYIQFKARKTGGKGDLIAGLRMSSRYLRND